MGGKKNAIRDIFRYLLKKGAREAAKEISEMKGPGTINEYMAQNWFRRFKEVDTTLEDKPKSQKPSVV